MPDKSTSARGFLRAAALGFAVLTVAGVRAQNTPVTAAQRPASYQQPFHLYHAGIFGAYASSPLLFGTAPAGLERTSGGAVGGTATTGYLRLRPRSSIWANYTITYLRDLRYSEGNFLNHLVYMGAGGNVTEHWTINSNAGAEIMNTNEFLFRSGLSSRVLENAPTSDELAAAILSGAGNQQLASMLTSSPVMDLPARRVFFGDRVLNATSYTDVRYRKARLTLSFSGGLSRIQTLLNTRSGNTIDARGAVVPSATSGSAGATVGYSLTPRTQVGVSMAAQRTVTRLEDAYISDAQAFVARRMSTRWVVRLNAGAGAVTSQRTVYRVPTGPYYLAGGSVGYRTFAHSVLFGVTRSMGDMYGIGPGSTINTTGAWTWRRPGSGWRVFADGAHQRMRGPASVSASRANAGIARTLTRETTLSVTYAYLRTMDPFGGLSAGWWTHGVRVGLAWVPGATGR